MRFFCVRAANFAVRFRAPPVPGRSGIRGLARCRHPFRMTAPPIHSKKVATMNNKTVENDDLVIFAPKSDKGFVRTEMIANTEHANRWYKIDIRVAGIDNADNITAPAALICANFSSKQIAYICKLMPKEMALFLQGENGFFFEVVLLENGEPAIVHPLSDKSKYFRGDLVNQVGDLISILQEGVDYE